MDISFLGHSSFKIKGKEASVVCDPFDAKFVGFKFPSVEADIVTVSHNHPDHNQAGLVKGVKRLIDTPGEYEVMGISVLGFRAFHDGKKGEERGPINIFVYEVDRVRVCHLGDLGHSLSDELIEFLGDIDILLIPVGGSLTIGPTQATEIIREIEPAVIIPMHFAEEGLNQDNFAKLVPVEAFLKEAGLTVEKLPKLSLKKEEIDSESQKVVLLERK